MTLLFKLQTYFFPSLIQTLKPGLRVLLWLTALCLMVISVAGYSIYLWYLRTNEVSTQIQCVQIKYLDILYIIKCYTKCVPRLTPAGS